MKKYFLYTTGAIGVALVIGLGGIIGREVLWPISDLEFSKEVDDTFQRKPIYRIKKTEFPEWYDRYIDEVVRRLQNGANEADIRDYTRKEFVAFRRIYAASALQASPEKLDSLLNTHLAIIRQLEKSSSAACAEDVIHGQIKSQHLLRILEEPTVAQAYQSNAINVLEAIVDGRTQHFEYGKPTVADNRLLTAHLSERGWSEADLKLVADRAALAAAPNDKACSLVRRYYEALATIEPSSTRSRLIVSIFGPLLPTRTARAALLSNLISFS